jgi:hypothetical protein
MKRLIAAVLCASFAAGCSTTATITRKGGQVDEAIIARSTSSSVMVETGAGERPIPRDEITDIDHPGNVHAVIGSLLLAYGILNISVGASQCDRRGAAFCTGVFTPAAVGLGMTIWGHTVWSRSNGAGRPSGPRGPELSLAPAILRVGDRTGGGGALLLRY